MGHVAVLVSLSNNNSRTSAEPNHSIIEGVALLGIFFTYFPTRHSRMHGLNNKEMLKRIDWIGGALLTIGLTLL